MRLSNRQVITARGTTHIVSDTWYHLAGAWDGVLLKVYVNGILDAQAGPFTNLALGSNSQTLTIGRHAHLAYPYFVDGIIDEIKIYDYAMSGAEILDEYAGSSVTTRE